jgi:hypothetical protein
LPYASQHPVAHAISGLVHVLDAEHVPSEQSGVGDEQMAHDSPSIPHAAGDVPSSQMFPSQHPVHEIGEHSQVPSSHASPVGQVPVVQTPPHPSSPPHAASVQSGVQPQTPSVQVRPLSQTSSVQQASSSSPHDSQPLEQTSPVAQAVHATPPTPHALGSVPSSQPPSSQQPPHPVASQTQAPDSHESPVAQVPVWQMPPQPSACPHAPSHVGVHSPPQMPSVQVSGMLQELPLQHGCPLAPQVPPSHSCVQTPPHPSLPSHDTPAQLGTQVPTPQTLGVVAPHVSPVVQPPQLTRSPHSSLRSPHLPSQRASSFAVHPVSPAPSRWPPESWWLPASPAPAVQMQASKVPAAEQTSIPSPPPGHVQGCTAPGLQVDVRDDDAVPPHETRMAKKRRTEARRTVPMGGSLPRG